MIRSPTEIPPVSENVGESSLDSSCKIVSIPETPLGLRLWISDGIACWDGNTLHSPLKQFVTIFSHDLGQMHDASLSNERVSTLD